jgi:hypothetical protein
MRNTKTDSCFQQSTDLFGNRQNLTFKFKSADKYFSWRADGQKGDFLEFACGFGLFSSWDGS